MSGYVLVYPPNKPDPRWEVWFGDGIYFGKHLASCTTLDEANRTCVLLAMSMRARALPWQDNIRSTTGEGG